jgi:Fe-S-cluster containining protein
MPFECEKYHCKCKARCCGIVPIPLTIWQKNQHNIQREVKEAHKVYVTDQENVRHTAFLPITEDHLCPFLRADLKCAIYENRPKVCKKFGDESHWALRCPMQHKDGTPRSKEDLIELTTSVDKWITERIKSEIGGNEARSLESRTDWYKTNKFTEKGNENVR